MSLLQVAEWLEATALALWVKESQYGFVIVVAVHILGLTLSVGTLIWFDLRLLGVSMLKIPVSKLYRRLMPLILTGFAVMFVSGGILLAAYATGWFLNKSRGIRRYIPLFEKISGVILLIAGILLVSGSFSTLSAYFARFTPDFLLERL